MASGAGSLLAALPQPIQVLNTFSKNHTHNSLAKISRQFWSWNNEQSFCRQLCLYKHLYVLCISAHVLTEDVLYREVTPRNHLLSRRLLTKTNRLPGWAERVFPRQMARAVYVLEDSIVDPHAHTLITKTWNLNHNKLMVRLWLPERFDSVISTENVQWLCKIRLS